MMSVFLNHKKLLNEKSSLRINNSTTRMNGLLEHLLDYCEKEELQEKIELVEFDIAELLNTCISSNEVIAEVKNIKINNFEN